MARPVTISDESILEAAREVLLERGQLGTTAEVAQRAGVSEGIIFKRFKTKDELFRRALTLLPPEDVPWIASLPARVGTGDVRTHLEELALAGVEFFRRIVPLIAAAHGG